MTSVIEAMCAAYREAGRRPASLMPQWSDMTDARYKDAERERMRAALKAAAENVSDDMVENAREVWEDERSLRKAIAAALLAEIETP